MKPIITFKYYEKALTFAILAITVLLIVTSLQTSFAVNQTVDQTLTSDGTTIQNNLTSAIGNATPNDTITINKGTYTGTSVNTGLNINKNLTIQGNTTNGLVIIDAGRSGRIFTINNNLNVKFINIIFINGNYTGNGGAIYNSNSGTKLTFINCEFKNNTASSYGGAIYNGGNNLQLENCTFTNNKASHAGAIYNQGNNFIVIDSAFENNIANTGDYYGGAIFDAWNTNSSLTNCIFTNNTAGWGGAIFYYEKNNVTITNCTFKDNSATRLAGAGGAIYIEGDNYNIINSTFENCSSAGYGGALINHGANSSLIDCTFKDNKAYVSGGAVYVHTKSTIGTLTYNFKIANCSFTNNEASSGGAIYNQCNSTTLTSSNFTENVASKFGGAISNIGNLKVMDSNFINNKAINPNYDGTGGAIHNYAKANMTLLHNSMSGNSADLGQMISNNGNMGILNLIYLNNSTHYVKVGQNVILYAILTDDMGNTVTGQNISFYVNGIYVGSSTSIEGYANLTFKVTGALGDVLPVNGTYAGIGDFPIIIMNGELIIRLNTNSTITAPDAKENETITISGIATDEDGDPIGNTEITVTINNQSFNVTTDINGEWSLNFTSTIEGSFIAVVSWIGNSTHAGFTNSTTFNVVKENDVIIEDNTDTENNYYTEIKHKDGIYIENIPEDDDDNEDNTNTVDNIDETDETTNNLTSKATMNKTGLPIIAIVLLLLSIIGLCFGKKQ